MKIKGAIFDMDGTLVDSLILWDILWHEIGIKYFNDSTYRPPQEADKTIRTMHFKDATKFLHKECNMSGTAEELYNFSNEILIDFYKNKVKIKKGVIAFLDHLYQNNVKMCIASASAPELVKSAIEHCKINKYFQNIVSCADIGKGKDSPDVFLIAKDLLRTELEDTWVFEDSYLALITAKNAGFKTVGVYDKYSFNQDVLQENSTIYLGENEDYTNLINIFTF